MTKAEYDKMWRLNNPEKWKKYTIAYRNKNKEAIRERHRQWVLDNPERWKEIQDRYRNKPETIIRRRERERRWFQNLTPEEKKLINDKKKDRYRQWREKTPLKKARPGTGWEIVRLKVLARDDCKCRICGRDAKEVHHIDGTGSNRTEKEKNNNMDNLITVCRKCHAKLDLRLKGEMDFGKGTWKRKDSRNSEIIRLSKNLSQTQISKIMGITRQRVNQIVKRENIS